jgi:hypothetical protein
LYNLESCSNTNLLQKEKTNSFSIHGPSLNKRIAA